MPRISLWKDGQHSNDYRFIDGRIREMFTAGGTAINLHKYLGPISSGENDDATKPNYQTQSERNIQDLLFLENRDRKYDTSIYSMRGIYQVSDSDFDLSQFGLFLATDTMFIAFHLNDMVETIGRKIMAGDVLELPHKKDFYSLDTDIPAALKRYYVVQDTSTPAEGYSMTWWPHLWRAKCTPLVDSQEYKDILNNINAGALGSGTLATVLSQYDKTIEINDAIIAQATAEVPESGYDTSAFYVLPLNNDGTLAPQEIDTADDTISDASSSRVSADNVANTPRKDIEGYLTGDGLAPNGLPVISGTQFPNNPMVGDYVLRLDMFPNRLFRFDSRRWVKVEDDVRGTLPQTQKGGFINNNNTFETDSGTMASKQGLSKALKRNL